MSVTSAVSQQDDLTAKARIRNAALELYATYGEDATSMRTIADAAKVTVGLIVHHFATKDGLREAVEQHVVDMFAAAIDDVPGDTPPVDVGAARDESVARMLAAYPAVVGYLRRAVLDQTGYRGRMLELLTNLAAEQVTTLRNAGVASTAQRDSSQVIRLMVRQLGQLFLQPMVDSMWQQLAGPGAEKDGQPELVVRVQESAGSE